MFAILISEENMPKIIQDKPSLDEFAVNTHLPSYFRHPTSVTKSDWYFVSGYTNPHGQVFNWVILPAYILVKNFEIDFEHAKTEFDQIVRK